MRLRAAALILSCDIVPSISVLVPAPGHGTEEVTMEGNNPREDCAALMLGHYDQGRSGAARIRQTWLPTAMPAGRGVTTGVRGMGWKCGMAPPNRRAITRCGPSTELFVQAERLGR